MKKEVKINGINCSACKMLIEDVCSDFDGVKNATVDVAGKTLSFECADDFVVEKLYDEIDAEGDFTVVR